MTNVSTEARSLVRQLYHEGATLSDGALELLARTANQIGAAGPAFYEFTLISAWALLQLPTESRLALMRAYDFTAIVSGFVEEPPEEWPSSDAPTLLSSVTPGDIAAGKIAAQSSISHMADRFANKIANMNPRDAVTYLIKADEARAFNALDPSAQAAAVLSDYPHLQAEVVSGRQPDLATAASFAIQTDGIWRALNASIETGKLTAFVAIDAATTLTEIETAKTAAQASYQAVVDLASA